MEYLEGEIPRCLMDDELPIQLFLNSDYAEVQREITGLFVVVKQEGTLDRPAIRRFITAALRVAKAATQEDAPDTPPGEHHAMVTLQDRSDCDCYWLNVGFDLI